MILATLRFFLLNPLTLLAFTLGYLRIVSKEGKKESKKRHLTKTKAWIEYALEE